MGVIRVDERSDPSDDRDGSLGVLEGARRYWWAILLFSLATALLGFRLSLLVAPEYEASARLLLVDPRNAGVFGDDRQVSVDPSRYLRNQAEIARSSRVAAVAAEALGDGADATSVAQRVDVTASPDLDLLGFAARDEDPTRAAAIANAVAEAYQDVVRGQVGANAEAAIRELEAVAAELQAELDTADRALRTDTANPALQVQRDASIAQLTDLRGRAEQLQVDAALYGAGVELYEAALPPSTPVSPQPARNAVAAAALGLLLATALAWWRVTVQQVAREGHDAASVLHAPLLGEVPEFRAAGVVDGTPTLSAPGSAAAEAFQFGVAALEYALSEAGGSVVVVTSAEPGEGKTTTALNLAIAARQDGRRVLLVDADLRLGRLSALCGASGEHGLQELAEDSTAIADCLTVLNVGNVALDLIPAGSGGRDVASFFRTSGFRKAMVRVRAHADLIVVDSPPLLAVSDALAMAGQADGVLLVVGRGTSLRVLSELRGRLALVGAPLLGYLFNRSRSMPRSYGDYVPEAQRPASRLRLPRLRTSA